MTFATSQSSPTIVDIREKTRHQSVTNSANEDKMSNDNASQETDLASTILERLCLKEAGKAKSIPTVVLYDDRGLQLFDEITYLEEYKSLGTLTNVKMAGLWRTYEEWTIICQLVRTSSDNLLIGIDRRNGPQDITLAYNDLKRVTREFIMNGLDHTNVLDQKLVDREKFEYFGRYNIEEGRHEAYYQVKQSHQLKHKIPKVEEEEAMKLIDLAKDELINIEYLYKWSPQEAEQLFEHTELTKVTQWTSSSGR
ncbi:hypothetical protein BGX27_002418 [Mortierella sp. AM989]|nr:hypothetical protein BGX27_002418 [Mortierella sp. AM989]